jgi:hypothetical protein
MEWLQSHKWLTASSYLVKYLHISSYIRKQQAYDFATGPIWISLFMRKIYFSFLSIWLFKEKEHTVPYLHSLTPLIKQMLGTVVQLSVVDCQCRLSIKILIVGAQLWV